MSRSRATRRMGVGSPAGASLNDIKRLVDIPAGRLTSRVNLMYSGLCPLRARTTTMFPLAPPGPASNVQAPAGRTTPGRATALLNVRCLTLLVPQACVNAAIRTSATVAMHAVRTSLRLNNCHCILLPCSNVGSLRSEQPVRQSVMPRTKTTAPGTHGRTTMIRTPTDVIVDRATRQGLTEGHTIETPFCHRRRGDHLP